MAEIITACNERYLPRMTAYLDSLRRHSIFPITLVTVGFNASYPGINCLRLERQANYGAPAETESPQHGSFLTLLKENPQEVVVFTDGDMLMQRDFSRAELEMLANLEPGEVIASYNSGADETLAVEAGRLHPRFPLEGIAERLGSLERPCYNIGVFVARQADYWRIYQTYVKEWELVSQAFVHPARQQWLVVKTIHDLGLRVKVSPYSFHANGHYGIPPGCRYQDGLLYCGDELVLFRHKL